MLIYVLNLNNVMIDFEDTRLERKVATVKIMSHHKLPHCNFLKLTMALTLKKLQYRSQ